MVHTCKAKSNNYYDVFNEPPQEETKDFIPLNQEQSSPTDSVTSDTMPLRLSGLETKVETLECDIKDNTNTIRDISALIETKFKKYENNFNMLIDKINAHTNKTNDIWHMTVSSKDNPEDNLSHESFPLKTSPNSMMPCT